MEATTCLVAFHGTGMSVAHMSSHPAAAMATCQGTTASVAQASEPGCCQRVVRLDQMVRSALKVQGNHNCSVNYSTAHAKLAPVSSASAQQVQRRSRKHGLGAMHFKRATESPYVAHRMKPRQVLVPRSFDLWRIVASSTRCAKCSAAG